MRFADQSLAPVADVPLAPLTTLGIGGRAHWFVRAETIEALVAAHAWAADRGLEVFVLGGGSNLVLADEGWPGLVLLVALKGVQFSAAGSDTRVTAGAGEPWDSVVGATVRRGLAGLECLSGIPGLVGGTPVQNVGAYGQDVSGAIETMTVFDRTNGHIVDLTAAECGFAYRMSRFKGTDVNRFIVCGVTFRLRAGPATMTYPDVTAYIHRHAITSPGVGDVRDAVLAIRRAKGMVIDASDPDTRSVGSFFMNPIVGVDVHERIAASTQERVPGFPAENGARKIPAAWLIEHAGFGRGYQWGPAGLSTRHPLAIVNRGGASARDIVGLAVRIKRQVADQFGIWLRPEPVFAGFGEDPDVAYLRRAHADEIGFTPTDTDA